MNTHKDQHTSGVLQATLGPVTITDVSGSDFGVIVRYCALSEHSGQKYVHELTVRLPLCHLEVIREQIGLAAGDSTPRNTCPSAKPFRLPGPKTAP